LVQGRPIRGSGVKDVYWLEPSGKEMNDEAWNAGFVRSLGMLLPGDQIEETDQRGQRIIDETLLLVLNAHDAPVQFTLPSHIEGVWEVLFDTAEVRHGGEVFPKDSVFELYDRSTALFRFRPSNPQES
jgi:glycogen operon protein